MNDNLNNQIISDEYIIEYFYDLDNKNKINRWKTKEIPEKIKQYLYNRFNDIDNSTTLKEIIQRIRYKVYNRPKCVICNNNYTKYKGIISGKLVYRGTCCKECEKTI